MWPRRTRILTLLVVAASGFVVLFLLAPIPLPRGYHDFADRRSILGIPDGLNVLSNIVFLLVGVQGVTVLVRNAQGAFRSNLERIPYFVFFAGVALTGIGYGYYHLAPDDRRLVWDLLPMTFSFVSLVAAITMERISVRAGLGLIAPLVIFGAASVLHWNHGALAGHGDIRFYLFVQFFSPVLIASMVFLFVPRYTGTKELAIAFALCVLAKLFELFDRTIFSAGAILSGHTLKHVTAGVACLWILRMLQTRGVRELES